MKKFSISKADMVSYWDARRKRRERILEERRNSAFSQKMKPVYDLMNRFSLVFHVLLAVVINFVIEIVSRHSLTQTWLYLSKTPLVFLYNSFMIFLTFMLVYFVKRRLFARIIIGGLWITLGICNGYMLSKRVTPFNAQDLKVARDAMTMLNSYFSPLELVLVIVFTAAVVVWVISMWRRGGQYIGKIHYIRASIGLGITIALFAFATHSAIDKRVLSTYFGNIAFAYEDYGFPYCFMSSIFNTGMGEPNDYSENKIRKISQNYEITESSTGAREDKRPNIIFVQLESYFDVNEAEFLSTSKDASPNLREMFKKYSSGYFKVPSVGAGTANTEFEVLTGMNLRFFGPGEYPYKTILKENTCESVASALAELGYGTHALHNNGGNFYSRSRVFNNIGFDSYTSKEFMNILQTTENGWAKDDILIPNVMECLDSTPQQDFVFCISVQGHGDYPAEKVLENPDITVDGIENTALKNKWEYYVNQVYEMDKFAGDLVAELEKRGEPTVVVFYGDHLPTLGLKVEDLTSRYLYNTNYVIWDNIGLEKEDRNIPAYQITADVFQRLDIHTGTFFNYHQKRRQTPDYQADLELLQYDILYGDQYVYRGEPPIGKGHMLMGIRDVELDSLEEWLLDGFLLSGVNFTAQSKVFINDEKQKSTFINNTRILLPETTIEDGDIIRIVQMGSGSTEFRRTPDYVYRNGMVTAIPGTGTKKYMSWVEQNAEDEDEGNGK